MVSDEQLKVLPDLQNKIDLVLQNDEHKIPTLSPIKRTAHPYKLYIGNHKDERRYVYLFRRGRGRSMVLRITGKNDEQGYYDQWEPTYYQTVDKLAYPFNETTSEPQFRALVKFYFILGLTIGRYTEDPEFTGTTKWHKDLRATCDEFIKFEREEEMEGTDGGKQELSRAEPLSRVTGTPAQLSRSPAPPSQPQSTLPSSSQPQRPSTSTSRRRSPLKRSRSLKAVPDESQEMMDHQDDIDISREQRRAGASNSPPQSPPSGLEANSPIYISSASPSSSPRVGYFQVSEEDREAERTGSFTSSSKLPADDKAALKDKYRELYQQRDVIQKEMDAIKEKLTEDEYAALVKEIENPQLATLKRV